ncbi:MAG: two-component regulator propeller domain-containing protein [Verrucomicrobiia bacterium]
MCRAPCIGWFVLGLLVGSGAASNSAPPPILTDPEYIIAGWESEDGLPESTVTAMVQTAEGYLWFGTFGGLVRFDGVKFTVLNPANTPALPSAGIVNLHLDQSNRLWVSTLDGLVVKDGAHWQALGIPEGWKGDYVRSFAERTNGDLLITTFDGHVLAFENNRLAELPSPPGQRGEGYLGAVDESGHWWLTQARFVFRWNGQGWTQVNATAPAFDRPYAACAPARGGGVWVLKMGELLRFRAGSEAARYPLPEVFGSVWMMVEDSNRDIWVGCNGVGLYRITPDGAFRNWSATNGLGCLSARCVFEDRERNLWIGTSRAAAVCSAPVFPSGERKRAFGRVGQFGLAGAGWRDVDGRFWRRTTPTG